MPTLRELTEYHTPTTIDEAVKLLRRRKIHTRPIGGGTALVPDASPDVQAVVDLSELGLSYIKTTEAGLEVGATTTLQTLIDDAQVQAYAGGVLVKAILDTASRNTREAATLAGSIVASDGKSPLLAVLFALGAQLTVRSLREQTVALEEFTPQAEYVDPERDLARAIRKTRALPTKKSRARPPICPSCVWPRLKSTRCQSPGVGRRGRANGVDRRGFADD